MTTEGTVKEGEFLGNEVMDLTTPLSAAISREVEGEMGNFRRNVKTIW